MLRIKGYTDELDSAESVIVSLALTIEARDSTTEGHCQRLAQYAFALGQALGLNDDDLSALARGGYLHDVGKIGIPDGVLLKPGPLTPDEYELIKQHPIVGERLCGELRSLRNVRPIVRHHHERLDGSGYPDGLSGDAIPLLAQITSIVDVFDALTTERPYRAALPIAAAAAGAPQRSGARLAPRRAGRHVPRSGRERLIDSRAARPCGRRTRRSRFWPWTTSRACWRSFAAAWMTSV